MGIRLLEAKTAPATLRSQMEVGSVGRSGSHLGWGCTGEGAREATAFTEPSQAPVSEPPAGVVAVQVAGWVPGAADSRGRGAARICICDELSGEALQLEAPGESPAGLGMAGDTQWEGSGALESGHDQV